MKKNRVQCKADQNGTGSARLVSRMTQVRVLHVWAGRVRMVPSVIRFGNGTKY